MSVIQPGLFMVIERFPDCRNKVMRLYGSSDSFRSLCTSYQQCTTAVRYWAKQASTEATQRHGEYLALQQELEMEILQFCAENQIAES